MSKEYRNVIIAVVSIIVIITIGILVYNQKNKLSPEQEELFSLPEGVELTQDQRIRYDAARTILEQNPQDVKSLVDIAQLKYELLDIDGAIEVYRKVLEIEPAHLVSLNNLGDMYNQKGDYGEAEKMYLTIIRTTPKWINAYRELGYIYYYHMPEKYPELEGALLWGIEKFQEFGEEAPIDFYSMLAVFYDETGQIDKAIEYLEKVVELTPENRPAKIRLEELKNTK